MSIYTKEPGWLYIETEAEKRAAGPKLATDERWNNTSKGWRPCNMDDPDFTALVYRRRIATAPTDATPIGTETQRFQAWCEEQAKSLGQPELQKLERQFTVTNKVFDEDGRYSASRSNADEPQPDLAALAMAHVDALNKFLIALDWYHEANGNQDLTMKEVEIAEYRQKDRRRELESATAALESALKAVGK